jgi:hypothetical protein
MESVPFLPDSKSRGRKAVRLRTPPPAPGETQRPTRWLALFVGTRAPECRFNHFPQSFSGQLDINHSHFDSDDQKKKRIKIDCHTFLLPSNIFSTRPLCIMSSLFTEKFNPFPIFCNPEGPSNPSPICHFPCCTMYVNAGSPGDLPRVPLTARSPSGPCHPVNATFIRQRIGRHRQPFSFSKERAGMHLLFFAAACNSLHSSDLCQFRPP